MPRPDNGIYIILGEANLVVTAMRRNSRWTTHSHQDDDQDPLITSFSQLKDILNTVADLDELAPNEFLSPFLEVIRSEDTTGPITGLALTSINKFLSYGLIDPSCETSAAAIENIADAVTHARFVGTDPGSDEVVLMKILYVLRTLLLTPAGAQLTNESVCEIMQSCFRITFEMRLSELLRRSAEHTLMDMVQLLFSRLPQFKEDAKWAINMKKLKMRAGGMDPRGNKKKRSPKPKQKRLSPAQAAGANTSGSGTPSVPESTQGQGQGQSSVAPDAAAAAPAAVDEATSIAETLNSGETIATTPVAGGTSVVDIHDSFKDADEREREAEQQSSQVDGTTTQPVTETEEVVLGIEEGNQSNLTNAEHPTHTIKMSSNHLYVDSDPEGTASDPDPLAPPGEHCDSSVPSGEEYISSRGVRFTQQQQHKDGSGPLIPYGLPCVRELFRFLISLTNPVDRHNTDVMTHMGLGLLTVALEAGADHIPSFSSLLSLVRDDMCKNLFFLLQTERLSLFAASVRVCFLLFESMRSHLKFQLEHYLTKLQDIIVSESPRISYEQREIALESTVQLLRVPGLVTELYLNYDCNLYCTNLFEDLMKLLSKNAFPVSGLFTTHLLSLDALLAVIDSIEQHCHHRVLHKAGESDRSADTPPRFLPEVRVAQDDNETTEATPPPSAPPPPPASGFAMADYMVPASLDNDQEVRPKLRDSRKGPQIRPNRMKATENIPSEEQLLSIKHKKKVYQTGTEQFNQKPAKGVAYMQEQGLLSTPLIPSEVVTFIKENPKLDKKQIGEYLANKKNRAVLEAYNRSFTFAETRIDEALRMYLESFRLPGEAPVISYLLENFADHWHKTNHEPFTNSDAAFTLGYAVIMLNVDQHNNNAKKQNIPMTAAEFKRNLKEVNGGEDFDHDMLDEIYNAIKNEEIVMPAEQTGLVKENYLWRVLLRRGATKDGLFIHAPTGQFDRDLFALVWGPTVAALSFVFDKSLDETIIQKAISGFRKCAMISAHYGLSDVFDNLVISLCKFTTLLSQVESADSIPIQFGSNLKAQLAAKTVFGLAHRHGDILREGWKNILDCQLQLYRAKMLPDVLTKVEDYIEGQISLVREEVTTAKADTGVLSSFYSYFTLAEPVAARGPSPEEQEAIRQAHRCIQECHVEQLINESKFLRGDSLQELLKALMFASRCPEQQETLTGAACDEDAAVFFLELLIRVVLQNRDRVAPFWQSLRDHIYNLAVNAGEHSFLVERAVVGLLRLAIRLLRREDIAPQVLGSLRMLLMMKPAVVHSVSRQVAFGLHDLLKTNAANIHSSQDWYTLFTLLEVCGAGTDPPPLMQVTAGVNVPESISDAGAQSDSELSNGATTGSESVDRGYTSDSELYEAQAKQSKASVEALPSHGSWLLVNREDIENGRRPTPINQYNIVLQEELKHHDQRALVKACETLAFLVRDAAHVTPHNFESCVHTIRTFVEASINGGRHVKQKRQVRDKRGSYKHNKRKDEGGMKKSRSSPSHLANVTDSDEDSESDGFHSLSIQLLDLMHTLHTRAATIFGSWAQEEKERTATPPAGGVAEGEPTEAAVEAVAAAAAGHRAPAAYLDGPQEPIDAATSSLWTKCWCPLLQGIARLCCDSRRAVRSQALTYLQRALLVHDLQTLSAVEWESCFNKVLFPLLSKLLDVINPTDPSGIEETRMRASTLVCKVFLQHLSPLLSLSTFTALWLTILDFMDKYMHADRSDLLCEAIPESLKNMLLVMNTAGILQGPELETSQLWKLTWDRIDTFLPSLRDELFKPSEMDMRRGQSPAAREPPPPQPGIPRGPSPPPPQAPPGPSQSPPTGVAPSPASGSPPVTASPPSSRSRPSDPCCTTDMAGALPSPATSTSQATSSSQSLPVCAGAGSPLTVAADSTTSSPAYILHPPLPQLPTKVAVSAVADSSGAATGQTTVPILLNPDLMKGTAIPFISPQNTPERKPDVLTEAR